MNLLHVTLELVPAGSPTGVAELMVYLAAQRMEVGGWMATGTVMDGRGTRELAPTPSDVEALGALFADAGFPAAPPEWPAPAGAPSHRAALRVVVDGQQVEREGALAPGGLAAHPGLRAALQRLAEMPGSPGQVACIFNPGQAKFGARLGKAFHEGGRVNFFIDGHITGNDRAIALKQFHGKLFSQ